MTLTEARNRIRRAARDAAGDNSAYADAAVDDVLQSCGEQFCRETHCVRAVADVPVAEGDAELTLTTPTGLGFTPERLLLARIDGQATPMERPEFMELVRLQVQSAATGCPTHVAFDDAGEGQVYPTPDDDYTLKLSWWLPFTTWTPGINEAAADAVTLNIRDEYLKRILPLGPAALLQHAEPDMAYASASWQKFLAVIAELRGAGSNGARTSPRKNGELVRCDP